ncbi:MAG TPA: hypothetical protein VHW71_10140 [Steroidobacteraceae bacterium]|nr:hypothetical protein [Steroidobacteraceae bacterium]
MKQGSRAGVLLLALLLFRAYIPAGFMPANGMPFALELCPAAMAMSMAGMPAHLHHHAGTHADFESCPSGSVPGAGPISHQVAFVAAGPAPVQRPPALETPRLGARPQFVHQPRGPPALA